MLMEYIGLRYVPGSSWRKSFYIFICENGGVESFRDLCGALLASQGPCITVSDPLPYSFTVSSERLVDIECLALKGRSSRVWIGCAAQNLGYAGGANVWIERLLHIPGWQGLWILNPDTDPGAGALAALIKAA